MARSGRGAEAAGRAAVGIAALALAAALAVGGPAAPALAQAPIDFGDDSGAWPRDGECDDPRFEGSGMADSPTELMRDRTDCFNLFKRGRIALRADGGGAPSGGPAVSGGVVFGDDSSQWANDGECDDPRFEGRGMARTLVEQDLLRDATDCRSLFEAGSIRLRAGVDGGLRSSAGIDFGDDSGSWPRDGECDDPRFAGRGMAVSPPREGERRDATDCRRLYEAGSIDLREAGGAAPAQASGAVDFGDDSGTWARDGECDDPRFEGEGMAATLLDEDVRRDATDCRRLFEAGSIRLREAGGAPPAQASGAVDFGDDSGTWARDGECDDPRFEGEGMAATLLDEDVRRDATDCRRLFEAGSIRLREAGGAPPAQASGAVDFGDDSGTWARDGECDDPRFEGEGMAATLLDEDIRRDATDCRRLFEAGSIRLREAGAPRADAPVEPPAGTVDASGVDFGDDSSRWANDGECDDPRFEGEGMAVQLQQRDVRRDAADCRRLFELGAIRLRAGADGPPAAAPRAEPPPVPRADPPPAPRTEPAPAPDAPPAQRIVIDGLDFGDDSSRWARDGECDDPRFVGEGMSLTPLASDEGRDATDCGALYRDGKIRLR